MKFTKEEISLCKQVAEKYRKKIKWGDYIFVSVIDGDKIYVVTNYFDKGKNSFMDIADNEMHNDVLWVNQIKKAIPLWTISDCLEFLREKGIRFAFYHYEVDKYYVDCGYDNKRQWSDIVAYKTPIEACLEAVLAVLKEES